MSRWVGEGMMWCVRRGGLRIVLGVERCFVFCVLCGGIGDAAGCCTDGGDGEEEEDENEDGEERLAAMRKKQEGIKKCPKCSVKIEKNGGCNHMTCRMCKHEFCWVCLEEYVGRHVCGNAVDPEQLTELEPPQPETTIPPFDIDYVCRLLRDILSSEEEEDPSNALSSSSCSLSVMSEVLRTEESTFSHCYTRYLVHHQEQALVESRMTMAMTMTTTTPCWKEGNARRDAEMMLVQARRFLKYCHAYVFFTYGRRRAGEEGNHGGMVEDHERGLFEDSREMLERNTEELNRLLLSEEVDEDDLEHRKMVLEKRTVSSQRAVVERYMQNILQLLAYGRKTLGQYC